MSNEARARELLAQSYADLGFNELAKEVREFTAGDERPSTEASITAIYRALGQGAGGACCEAMREACALKVLEARLHTDICTCDWCYALKTAAAGIRALPLPVSADGGDAMSAWRDLTFEQRRDISTLLQQTAGARTRYEAVRSYMRTNLKSKQPDTGAEK